MGSEALFKMTKTQKIWSGGKQNLRTNAYLEKQYLFKIIWRIGFKFKFDHLHFSSKCRNV
jgi:hypothetical protein